MTRATPRGMPVVYRAVSREEAGDWCSSDALLDDRSLPLLLLLGSLLR